MTHPANVITLDGLRKVFQTDEVETHALSDVHLTVARGEYVSISGPSGCGKTTLLSILGLLDTASGGSYVLNGHDVAGLNAAQRARIRNAEIGFIFQAFNLIGDLTVQENVELPLTYRGGIDNAERRARVQEALERVGMAHRMRHYPAQLSGGQQQRVAVARALALDPPLILADEPTAQLDYVRAGEVVQLLRVLAAGDRVVVVATHDTRIVPLADIVIQLSPTAVPTRPQQAPVLLGPGSVLLEQGTVEDLIYVVTEGEVEIAPDSAGAGDGLLKIGKPDQYAGQLGPMVRIPRSATVRAPREATVVSYTVDAFRQQFGRPPVPDVPNEPAST